MDPRESNWPACYGSHRRSCARRDLGALRKFRGCGVPGHASLKVSNAIRVESSGSRESPDYLQSVRVTG